MSPGSFRPLIMYNRDRRADIRFDGCVRLPEWTNLLEWIFICDFLVPVLHFVCVFKEWHTEATESKKYK